MKHLLTTLALTLTLTLVTAQTKIINGWSTYKAVTKVTATQVNAGALVSILPARGAGKTTLIDKVVLKFTASATAYTATAATDSTLIYTTFKSETDKKLYVANTFFTDTGSKNYIADFPGGIDPNVPIYIKFSSALQAGTGLLTIVIYYKLDEN